MQHRKMILLTFALWAILGLDTGCGYHKQHGEQPLPGAAPDHEKLLPEEEHNEEHLEPAPKPDEEKPLIRAVTITPKRLFV